MKINKANNLRKFWGIRGQNPYAIFGEAQTTEISRSPTSKATCRGCYKRIGKGSPRVVIAVQYKKHPSYFCLCYSCGVRFLTEKKKETISKLKTFKRMIINNKKSINQMEVLNQKIKAIEELKNG
jgi:hypothetical protein